MQSDWGGFWKFWPQYNNYSRRRARAHTSNSNDELLFRRATFTEAQTDLKKGVSILQIDPLVCQQKKIYELSLIGVGYFRN